MQSRQTMKELVEKLWGNGNAGNFVNTETAKVVPMPQYGFPIFAGPWPNPNVGCRQVRCSSCAGLAGLSSKGWELHQADPENRPIFCPMCCFFLVELDRKLTAAERVTKSN